MLRIQNPEVRIKQVLLLLGKCVRSALILRIQESE
jgi:hypothetical protein